MGISTWGPDSGKDRKAYTANRSTFGPKTESIYTVEQVVDEMIKTWPDGSWQLDSERVAGREATLVKFVL